MTGEIVLRGATEYGIKLPASAGVAFSEYAAFLEQRGRVINLTAIEGPEDTARLHFLDSLALLNVSSFKDASVIDIGSGAGFPGLPLRIAEPTIALTLLDAQLKRVDFLSELCERLAITDVQCIHARAETAARTPEMRDSFDYAVSRAVARLNMLCELCLPFVRIGGEFIAMKSVDSGEEIDEAAAAIDALGAKLEKTVDYTIPGTHIIHRAVVIRKQSETSDKYPRRFAKIEKSPIVSRETIRNI